MKSLEEKVVEFAHILRRFNINVTHSGIADALEAIALVGLEREDFYNALKVTLIKEHADMSVFVSLFRLFFGEKPQGPPKEDTGDPFDGPQDGSDDGRESGRVEGANSPGVVTEQRVKSRIEGEPHQMLIRAVREGDYDMLQSLAHQAIENLGTLHPHDIDNVTSLVKRAKRSIGWSMAVDELFGGLLSARAFFL
ncbi:MAG TPA: hypothetical protein PLU81_12645 [Deltaproteobacteria bacterium]|nr:hypothetical protein [Deltaproteobacteria bacterium]HPR52634.1 hypothetical protein [Deltaproteobacteria bacterium]